MNAETIRVGHMFAGIGGFSLGLQQASPRYKTVWANEIDKYACQIYRKNFPQDNLIEGDIKEVNPADLPDCDIIDGGFPCQPFSMAGKREGFQDIRGTLFFEIMRIAKVKRPKILFLENVKGLLSHDNGDTFETILRTLGNAGYWYEYKVLNSKFFGVPQNRVRVFIIGHLRGAGSRQIFPIGESCELLGENHREGQVCSTITSRYHKRGHSDPYVAILRDNLGGNIKDRVRENGCAWTLGGSETLVGELIQLNDDDGKQINRIYSPEGISPTVPTACGGNHIPKIAQALQTDGFLRQGLSFGTSNPQSSRNIRRLTPTECERLQGFPDGWTKHGIVYNQESIVEISDTQRYKTLGNAVTVPVIQAIGELILEAWN